MEKKCSPGKHRNVRLSEWTPRHMVHIFENGKYCESIGGEYGNIDPVVRVTCLRCGFDRNFNTYAKNCPDWVKKMQEALLDDE